MTADAARLLAAFDEQLRVEAAKTLPAGARLERDGPLLRIVGPDHRGFICYRSLDGVEGAQLDELIARQVRFFAKRGEAFEWKTYSHDHPADLADRLRRAGLVAEETETVVIAPVATVASAPRPPAGVTLRDVSARADLELIVGLQAAVSDRDETHLAPGLEAELAAAPDALAIVVAETEAGVVCAGWVRFPPDTEFATLWGGATHPAWRGRGVYRAVVAYRANLAARRGCRYLQVDASDDSRPILERLGFVAVTTTTPMVWTPPG